MSNITHINDTPSSQLESGMPSIDSILKEMEAWRASKKSGYDPTPIPEELWHKIFSLGKVHSLTKIKALFGISSSQYNKKYAQLYPDTPQKIDDALASIDFCEVKPKESIYQPLNIPATNTVIVEFCRGDGKIMKIHTTTHSFKDLIQGFFTGAF